MLKAAAQDGRETRQRIVEAAFETLRASGFAGTSARSIARTGRFNQALIFYYFGSINELLVAALDMSSERRMTRYQETLAGIDDLPRLLEAAASLYREDAECGHTTVLAELFAAALAVPALAAQLKVRMERWISFTEELMRRFLGHLPLSGPSDLRAAAQATLALYLGIDLLVHADGDWTRVDIMFEEARRMGAALHPLLERS
ncbi:MAG TPA: TetR family transcriptional regulator [Candidatus Dormibacteraeota bacterium]|nr:TetR family transcriptional regulator [Candidatus Dormibacteraeota bacterium]